MPDEDCNQDRHEDDHYDADRRGAVAAAVVDYNRTVSHKSVCSFPVLRRSGAATCAPHARGLIPRSGLPERLPGGRARVILAAAGLLVSAGTAASAAWRAVRGTGNVYANEVYGMTAATHARYAAAGTMAACLCAAAWFRPEVPETAAFAGAVLVSVFYFTSFLRGFSDE